MMTSTINSLPSSRTTPSLTALSGQGSGALEAGPRTATLTPGFAAGETRQAPVLTFSQLTIGNAARIPVGSGTVPRGDSFVRTSPPPIASLAAGAASAASTGAMQSPGASRTSFPALNYCQVNSCNPVSNMVSQLLTAIGTAITSFSAAIERLLARLALSQTAPAPPSSSTPPSSQAPAATPPVSTTPGAIVPANTVPTPQLQSGTLPFQKKLLERLSDHERLSEAELRSAIVGFQLYQKSPPLENQYYSALKSAQDGGAQINDAVMTALSSLQKTGAITPDEVRWVYSLSARAAQLDDNLTYVRTTAGDGPSFELKNALQIAEVNLASIQSGSIKVPMLASSAG